MQPRKIHHYHEFSFKNEDYTLEYEDITVQKAADIDYNSYTDAYSSLQEWKNILQINFKIHKNGSIIFDSERDRSTLDFRLCKIVCGIIHKELCCSKEEIEQYIRLCTEFLKNRKLGIPYELLISENIISGNVTLNLSDIENMNIKKYEKIKLSLELLNTQSEN